MTASSWIAHGSDHLKVSPDGEILLACRLSKEWTGRRAGDGIRSPFPGTCVRWQDTLLEVVAVEELPVGVRYRLRPWEEQNVVRVVEDYDEQSEKRRSTERSTERLRTGKRQFSIALAPLVGLLPASVQEEMESDLGISGWKVTAISVIPLFAVGAFSLVFFMIAMMGALPDVLPELSLGWIIVGMYFFPESAFRFGVAFMQAKPCGSILGVIPWSVWKIVTGGLPKRTSGAVLTMVPPHASVLLHDAVALREPLLALLSPEEQTALASQFGFDFIRWGKRTAWLLLVTAGAGVVTSGRGLLTGGGVGKLISLAVAAYIVLEQVVRLRQIGRGLPAGSVLGFVARPFARKVLGKRG